MRITRGVDVWMNRNVMHWVKNEFDLRKKDEEGRVWQGRQKYQYLIPETWLIEDKKVRKTGWKNEWMWNQFNCFLYELWGFFFFSYSVILVFPSFSLFSQSDQKTANALFKIHLLPLKVIMQPTTQSMWRRTNMPWLVTGINTLLVVNSITKWLDICFRCGHDVGEQSCVTAC